MGWIMQKRLSGLRAAICDCRFPSFAAAIINGREARRFRCRQKTRWPEPAPRPHRSSSGCTFQRNGPQLGGQAEAVGLCIVTCRVAGTIAEPASPKTVPLKVAYFESESG